MTIVDGWKERALTDQFQARAHANTATLERQFTMMLRACLKAGLSIATVMVIVEHEAAKLRAPHVITKKPTRRKKR